MLCGRALAGPGPTARPDDLQDHPRDQRFGYDDLPRSSRTPTWRSRSPIARTSSRCGASSCKGTPSSLRTATRSRRRISGSLAGAGAILRPCDTRQVPQALADRLQASRRFCYLVVPPSGCNRGRRPRHRPRHRLPRARPVSRSRAIVPVHCATPSANVESTAFRWRCCRAVAGQILKVHIAGTAARRRDKGSQTLVTPSIPSRFRHRARARPKPS
jgi:hypothetical protein